MPGKIKQKKLKNTTNNQSLKAISIEDRRLENYYDYYYNLKLNWLHSSLRSLIHCFNHRLFPKRRYLGMSAVLFLVIIIIAIIYNNYKSMNLFLCPSNITDYKRFQLDVDKKINVIRNEMLNILENERIKEKEIRLELLESYKDIADDMTQLQQDINSMKSMLHDIRHNDHDQSAKISTNFTQIEARIKWMRTERKKNMNNISKISNEINSLNHEIENISKYISNHIRNIEPDLTKLKEEVGSTTYLVCDNMDQRMTVVEKQIENIKKLQKRQSQAPDINPYFITNDIIDQKPDFTLMVVYHTELMTSSWIQEMESNIYYFITRNYNQNAIQPSFRIGDCVPLKFIQDNFIIFKLRDPDGIVINGVTYEHISINLLPNNRKQSAPKEMSLEFSNDGYNYHRYNDNLLYDPDIDGSTKYYDIISTEKSKYVKLNVLSNYGAEYTCLYRVKVH